MVQICDCRSTLVWLYHGLPFKDQHKVCLIFSTWYVLRVKILFLLSIHLGSLDSAMIRQLQLIEWRIKVNFKIKVTRNQWLCIVILFGNFFKCFSIALKRAIIFFVTLMMILYDLTSPVSRWIVMA